MRRWPLVLGVGAVVALSTVAALGDEKSDCLGNKDHDLRIMGCSAIIGRTSNHPIAYHNRGTAYYLKGDVDSAISDLSKAIELNPTYAPAYNSRGRAYASKGDFPHAVADVTKATELASNAPRSAAPQVSKKVSARKAKVAANTAVAANPGVVTKETPKNAFPVWAQDAFAR